MTRRIALAAALTAGWFLLLSVLGQAQQIGEPLPPWSAGTLEIPQISTGRGNSALLIFPDGTSLMVDTGDLDGRQGSPAKSLMLLALMGAPLHRSGARGARGARSKNVKRSRG